MKLRILFLTFLLSSTACFGYDYLFEGGIAVNRFVNHTMRKTYSPSELVYQAEVSARVWKPIFFYANGDLMYDRGYSLGIAYPTKMNLWGISFGPKLLFKMSSVSDFYFQGGPKYFFFNVHNKSPYVVQHLHEQGFGYSLKMGVLLHVGNRFFVDLFSSYANKTFLKHFDSNIVPLKTSLEGVYVLGISIGAGV